MFNFDPVILSLAVALGIGLLIGTERERRKGTGPERSAAGLRTFTLASLTGAVSFIAGGAPLLAVTTAGIFGLAALGYWRSDFGGHISQRREDDTNRNGIAYFACAVGKHNHKGDLVYICWWL